MSVKCLINTFFYGWLASWLFYVCLWKIVVLILCVQRFYSGFWLLIKGEKWKTWMIIVCVDWQVFMWTYILLRHISLCITIPRTGSLCRPGRHLSDLYSSLLPSLWHWNIKPHFTIYCIHSLHLYTWSWVTLHSIWQDFTPEKLNLLKLHRGISQNWVYMCIRDYYSNVFQPRASTAALICI